MPFDWKPHTVWNPREQCFFSDVAAWEFIAETIEAGHAIELVVLERPPGKTGYVLCVKLEALKPDLYIKLMLGGGFVIGRSFHYSYHV